MENKTNTIQIRIELTVNVKNVVKKLKKKKPCDRQI